MPFFFSRRLPDSFAARALIEQTSCSSMSLIYFVKQIDSMHVVDFWTDTRRHLLE